MAQQDSIILLTSNSNNNIYFSNKKKYLYFKDSNGYEYELTKNVLCWFILMAEFIKSE